MQLDHKIICQFRFICTESWEGLLPIASDLKKRYCAVCKNSVYLTTSYEELDANVAAKRCIAVFLPNPEGLALDSLEFMGDITPTRDSTGSDPFLITPINEMGLSESTLAALRVSKFQLVGDLVIFTRVQLLEGFLINEIQLNEILEVLAARGLMIGMEIRNWDKLSAKYR